MAHPPMKSKYTMGPTEYELKTQREAERREKARLRMARRAELKARPLAEQEQAAARARAYQATYREKNRYDLKIWEAQRRIAYVGILPLFVAHLILSSLYQKRYGPAMTVLYAKARRSRIRQARAKAKAKEAYHIGNESDSPTTV
ncbi:hypothetical protein C8R43DRAFT_955535 [Mycena crocata]|nr:hypothetical protein C8R43DRAFT_955535 [Mycena crocata]